MSPFEIIWRAIAIVGVIITTLHWFGIGPQHLKSYFLAKKTLIFRSTYFVFAISVTLYFVFVIVYFPLALSIFGPNWAILFGIVIYSLIGIWLPVLQRRQFWTARLNRIILFASQLLAILILVGFWIVSWPEWLVPLVLTSLVVILLAVSYIMRRRNRRADNNTLKYWCRYCKKELEPSHTGPCPNCGKTGKDCRVVVEAKIGIRTGIAARHKREGFRKFMWEMISRWRPSKSPELPNGVSEERVTDKERDEYHHVIKDARTGKVIHKEHEPLNKHKKP